MFKFYENENVILPDGQEMTKDDLSNNSNYAIITKVKTVINISDEGLLTFFSPLSSLKDLYFIDEEDDDTALRLIENEIKVKPEKINIEAFNSYVDQVKESTKADAIHDEAIGELGVSTAALLESNSQLTATNADVLQAIGELGAMVAAMQVSSDTHSSASGETA